MGFRVPVENRLVGGNTSSAFPREIGRKPVDLNQFQEQIPRRKPQNFKEEGP